MASVLALSVIVLSLAAPATVEGKEPKKSTDAKLLKLLDKQDVMPIDNGPAFSDELVELGQALFFDPILSGNRDTSCATCHHPAAGTGDALSLPIGTGTSAPGNISIFRHKGAGREFVPRNAPEIFNRGSGLWTSQFWDSRVTIVNGQFISPAGGALPTGLNNVLSVQAMFPVTSRDEMRGSLDDWNDLLKDNELANPAFDNNLPALWDAIMARLDGIAGYANTTPGSEGMFVRAYGDVPSNLGFQHAANAIAAFEARAYGYDDSPFDEYLRGDHDALADAQKRGALLFFGRKAKCSTCHSGTLLTDQQHYNLAVPQLGPGKDETGLDLGRFLETGNAKDLFRFRTPPLRNVTATGPWMHNGAYGDLEDAVRHHLDPKRSLEDYNAVEQLVAPVGDEAELLLTVVSDDSDDDILHDLSRKRDIPSIRLKDNEVADIMAFLEALTVPDLNDRLDATIPLTVPSGLTIDDLP